MSQIAYKAPEDPLPQIHPEGIRIQTTLSIF